MSDGVRHTFGSAVAGIPPVPRDGSDRFAISTTSAAAQRRERTEDNQRTLPGVGVRFQGSAKTTVVLDMALARSAPRPNAGLMARPPKGLTLELTVLDSWFHLFSLATPVSSHRGPETAT